MNAYYNACEMAKRGYEVEVFTPRYRKIENRSANRRIEIKNCSVHYLRPLFSYGNAAFLPGLLWRLRRFDIVHLYYPFFGAAEVVVLAKNFSHFKLFLHHEMDIVGEGWLKKFFSFHTRFILPWILRNVDLLLVLSSDYFKNSDMGRFYDSKKFLPSWEVVPNGVDTELFQPASSALKFPIVIFAAGLDRAHYFKGVPILLKAVKLLKEQSFAVKLLVAGEGEMKKDYEKLAQDLNIFDSVTFAGLVTHDRLPEFYSSGSLFVMPSVGRTESFSIATAEAQACGLPAIVSDLPGMRVTIEDGVTGFLTKPGDPADLAEKIKGILQNQDLASKMGQAGRERMEKYFSWKVIGDKLEKLYKQALDL